MIFAFGAWRWWDVLPAWAAWPVAAVVAVLWSQLVYFFRDPQRAIASDSAALVSPADGTITDIGEVDEPTFPGGRAIRIGIFLSVFNVHINRSPRTARVTGLFYFPGKFYDARRQEAATQNEQLWIDLLDMATGKPLRVKQISGLLARRIVCWLRVGDTLTAGERFGMIKFGSRTEVYIPADMPVEPAVKVGQVVHGGATILLRFKE
jgi:phosphatidylserine decarboxylase